MKDRSQLIGIFLVICALVLMSNLDRKYTESKASNSVTGSENVAAEILSRQYDLDPGNDENTSVELSSHDSHPDEKLFVLENDALKVMISNLGGTIKSIELKKYPAFQDRPDAVVFNDGSSINALALATGQWNLNKFSQGTTFDVVSAAENSILLQKTLKNGIVMTRKYSIPTEDGKKIDGHVVKHEILMENNTDSSVAVGQLAMFLGTMPAAKSDAMGDYLNFGTFDGKKDHFINLRDFRASNGFLGFKKRPERQIITGDAKLLWGSIKNQFFSAIFTPETQADGYVVFPISASSDSAGSKEEGIAAALLFNIGTLDSGEKKSLASEFYVGPKDFSRLSALGKEQDRVMQFGFFGSISELLLRLMIKIHSIIPNWGWTIIILTTIVKLVLWPFTNAQVRSSKKMAAIQQPIKEIKEKFKNNPQKLQSETLKLFKANKINPAAGCLPIFLQIPIFFGLYYMLRTASHLRFAHFLWIKDLSLPDTVARIGHFPVNILPVIMGITMIWQMHMSPMPATDNSQKFMFRLLPVVFLLFCYNLPSGLVLYWTVQNLLTIVQQLTVFRGSETSVDPVLPKDDRAAKKQGHGNVSRRVKRRK
jgi:YidC/Oxa1 family membrane protein insertase